MDKLLEKSFVNSNELEALLKAREEGKADFLLVDVREPMEYDMSHIKGVDMLKPTSSFQSWASDFLDEYKTKQLFLHVEQMQKVGSVQRSLSTNGNGLSNKSCGGIGSIGGGN